MGAREVQPRRRPAARRRGGAAAHTRAEKRLREIVAGTSAETGQVFFEVFVQHVAAAIGVRYALAAELMEDRPKKVRTLAVWSGAGLAENFEYDLAGTPCENVAGRKTCFYPNNVRAHFPEDRLLAEMDVTSYLGTPVFDLEGNPLGLLVVMNDKPIEDAPSATMTLEIFAGRAGAELERKRTEEALRRSEERFRLLAEHAQDVIIRYRVGESRGYEYVSPAITALTGYSPEDFYADPDMDFRIMHPDDLPRLRQAVAEHRTQATEARWLRKDGSVLWTEQRLAHVLDETGTRVAIEGIVRDVTERKEAEDALRQAREELEGRVENQMLRRNPYGVTFRELTTLHLVAAGKADREIATELGISPRTVHKHVANIRSKMGASSRTEAGVRAVRDGLLD